MKVKTLLIISISLSTMKMNRAKSLLLSESAFYTAATASVTDQEKAHTGSSAARRGGLARRFSTFNLDSTSDDNDAIIAVAKNFLAKACPELLAILEGHHDEISARDRLVKIGRNVNATLREFHIMGLKCSFMAAGYRHVII